MLNKADSDDDFQVISEDMLDEFAEYEKPGTMQMLLDKAKKHVTNLYFAIQNQTYTVTDLKLSANPMIMMGTVVRSDAEFMSIYSKMLYFSYRAFKTPLTDPAKKIKVYNDTLWGCSIRCSQMMFSEIFKRMSPKKPPIPYVVELFMEDRNAPFSLHEICQISYQKYSGKIGQYWNPLTAMMSIKDLLLLKFSDKFTLQFCHFNNNGMRFKEFTKGNFGDDEWFILEDDQQRLVSLEDSQPPLCEELLTEKKLVFFTAMLGDTTIHAENFTALRGLMKLSSSVGFISGVETRAYYVIGICGEEFVFLDPHKTETNMSPVGKDYESFKAANQNIKKLVYTSFNPWVCMCFLIRSKKEIEALKAEFYRIIRDVSKCFIIEDEETEGQDEIEVFTKNVKKSMIMRKNSLIQEVEEDEYMDSFKVI